VRQVRKPPEPVYVLQRIASAEDDPIQVRAAHQPVYVLQ